jgi:LETM1 and EF-hand domain-containing protein 1
VAGKTRSFDVVEATLSSLPDEVIASVDISAKASELELEERKKRLEILHQQEELIKVFKNTY